MHQGRIGKGLAFALAVTAVAAAALAPAASGQAVIGNGTIQLGVDGAGQLNISGPASSGGVPVVGLRYVPGNYEGTGPGCLCEGWGVADAKTARWGGANNARGGESNLRRVSFSADGDSAVVVVEVLATDLAGTPAILRVTHDYHPIAATKNLYADEVTIVNVSGADIDLRYRRVMDWDVEPTAFSEFVTLETGNAKEISYTNDDGFDGPNPLVIANEDGIFFTGEAKDSGPGDHGALFNFNFGVLKKGATRKLTTYYGAAGNETGALDAVAKGSLEAYTFGQSSGTGGKDSGTPVTFLFGFSGVGGDPVIPPPGGGTDKPPNAAFTATPNPTDEDKPVAFDASSSTDDKGISKYEWDWNNDGTYDATGKSASHTFANPGTYTVTLRVTDTKGQTDTASGTVTVRVVNKPPVADIKSSKNPATTGEDVTFSAADSTDSDGTIVAYDWDLDGDGAYETSTGSTPTVRTSYGDPGTRTVSVRVKDNRGATDTASLSQEIKPPSTVQGIYNCRARGGIPVWAYAGSLTLANVCLLPQSQTPQNTEFAPTDPIAACRERGGLPIYVFVGSTALANSCFVPQS